MIWAIAILLAIGAVYTCTGQENRTEAQLLRIKRDVNIHAPQAYNALDRQYRRMYGGAQLQLAAGKVFLSAGLILMIVRAVMEWTK